jgi:plastocyanin
MAAGAVLAVVLAGCGSDSETDAGTTSTTSTPSTASTAPSTVAAGSTPSSRYGSASAGPTAGGGSGQVTDAGTLTIDNFAFSPANPTFKVGQQVVVTNNDGVAHSWTSATGGFDTGLIQPGGSKTVTLQNAGTFDFVCTPHASFMTGTVTVTP